MSYRLTSQQIDYINAKYINADKRKEHIQFLCFQEWAFKNYKGTIEAATGVGKTRIACMAIIDQLKRDITSIIYIFVPTQILRDKDWPEELDRWCGKQWKCHALCPATFCL